MNTTNNSNINTQLKCSYSQIINLNIKINVKKMAARMLIDSIGDTYYNSPEYIAERKEIKRMQTELDNLIKQLDGEDLEDVQYIMQIYNEIYTNRMRRLMI